MANDSDHFRLPRGLAGSNSESRLGVVYRDHAVTLKRRVRAEVGSSDEASDLVHEAFARLAGARAATPLQNPCAFLNRIIRNLLIDRSRRLSVRPQLLPLDEGMDVAVPADQDQRIELEQMRERYREIVASLPPRMRTVFIMHRIEGLTYREIALRLDISVRTVEGHIAEAIVRIGTGLKDK